MNRSEKESLVEDLNRMFKVSTSVLLAVEDTSLEVLREHFQGPTAIAYTGGDPVALAKVLKDFISDHPSLAFKAGVVEGKSFSASDVELLAKMPSRPELMSKLVYLLNAPLVRLATALQSPLRGLASVLKQLAEKKQASGEGSTDPRPQTTDHGQSEQEAAEQEATAQEPEKQEPVEQETSAPEPEKPKAKEQETAAQEPEAQEETAPKTAAEGTAEEPVAEAKAAEEATAPEAGAEETADQEAEDQGAAEGEPAAEETAAEEPTDKEKKDEETKDS
jgi:large subunit ribosomal protein L10